MRPVWSRDKTASQSDYRETDSFMRHKPFSHMEVWNPSDFLDSFWRISHSLWANIFNIWPCLLTLENLLWPYVHFSFMVNYRVCAERRCCFPVWRVAFYSYISDKCNLYALSFLKYIFIAKYLQFLEHQEYVPQQESRPNKGLLGGCTSQNQ